MFFLLREILNSRNGLYAVPTWCIKHALDSIIYYMHAAVRLFSSKVAVIEYTYAMVFHACARPNCPFALPCNQYGGFGSSR
jgi:hypothetical protein